MRSSRTLHILITWMTALWPQSWLIDDLQVIANRKNLWLPNFCSNPGPYPSQELIQFASTYLRRHCSTLQLLQVMTHRLYTFTNCVFLLLVLNITKLTNFCIVGFTLMIHSMILMVCSNNRVPAMKKESCTLAQPSFTRANPEAKAVSLLQRWLESLICGSE